MGDLGFYLALDASAAVAGFVLLLLFLVLLFEDILRLLRRTRRAD